MFFRQIKQIKTPIKILINVGIKIKRLMGIKRYLNKNTVEVEVVMKILIADVEGFIEFHVAQELLKFHGAKYLV